MRVALMLPPTADAAEVPDLAARAEEQGFDLVASGEHVLFGSPTPHAFVTLAAAAAVTTRIRLLSAVTLLPLYPAALAAKMAATLDRVAGGRFELAEHVLFAPACVPGEHTTTVDLFAREVLPAL